MKRHQAFNARFARTARSILGGIAVREARVARAPSPTAVEVDSGNQSMTLTSTSKQNQPLSHTLVEGSCISVSWEIAKYLIPHAQKGEAEAMLLLCKLANPSWALVQLGDFSTEILAGGYSANPVHKCSAAGVLGSLAIKINICKTNGCDETSLVDTAYMQWNRAGIVPAVFCLGNPQAPGLEVYEFIEGSAAGTVYSKRGCEFMHNDEDATAFGALFAKVHTQPTDWYERYRDHVKGQWQEWFAGIETNQHATEMKSRFGDYASMIVQFSDFHSGVCNSAAAVGEACKEMNQPLHEFLDPASLLGRKVVGHGDAHGCNIMHRQPDTHGDLVLIDLDLVGRMPAAIDLGTPLCCAMNGPFGSFFGRTPVGMYPSLAQRRRVAKAYLEGMVGVRGVTRTEIDEIVFDMEVGVAIRSNFFAVLMIPLGLNRASCGYAGWVFVYYAKQYLNIFEAAKTDAHLKQRVLEQGAEGVVRSKLLELGTAPLKMDRTLFEAHWDAFGALGPNFSEYCAVEDFATNQETV